MSEKRATRTPGPIRIAVERYQFGIHPSTTADRIRLQTETRTIAILPNVADETERANADLLMRGWNTYDELVAALKDTLRALESHLDGDCVRADMKHRDLLCPCNQNEVPRARAALAKATIDPDDPATIDATAEAIIESGDLEGGA